jgi:hypothetical protein
MGMTTRYDAGSRATSPQTPDRNVALAVVGERPTTPVGISVLELHAGELGHEIAFGWPDVAEVARPVAHIAVRLVPVVVGCALLGGEVVGVKADVTCSDVERHCLLAGRKPSDTWNPQLDNEMPTGREMACGIAETGDLLSLRAKVADAVSGHEDE